MIMINIQVELVACMTIQLLGPTHVSKLQKDAVEGLLISERREQRLEPRLYCWSHNYVLLKNITRSLGAGNRG